MVLRFPCEPRERSCETAGHLSVAGVRRSRQPISLARSGSLHPVADDGRALPRPRTHELSPRQPGDRELYVKPIEERTGETLPVELDAVGRAPAGPALIAVEAAWARVRRCDQRETRGELDGPGGSRNHDSTVLQGLAQAFECVPAKLRDLVKEQDPVVCQAHLSRPEETTPPAQKPGRGDRVVGRTEGPLLEEPPTREQPGHGVKPGGLQRLRPRHPRQDRRQPAGEHRLAGSWRPHEQRVVASGGGDLQRPPRDALSPHLREVQAGRPKWPGLACCRERMGGLRLPRAPKEPHDFAEGVGAATTSTPSTRAASAAFASGTTTPGTPARPAAMATARMPGVATSSPFSESSPAKT